MSDRGSERGRPRPRENSRDRSRSRSRDRNDYRRQSMGGDFNRDRDRDRERNAANRSSRQSLGGDYARHTPPPQSGGYADRRGEAPPPPPRQSFGGEDRGRGSDYRGGGGNFGDHGRGEYRGGRGGGGNGNFGDRDRDRDRQYDNQDRDRGRGYGSNRGGGADAGGNFGGDGGYRGGGNFGGGHGGGNGGGGGHRGGYGGGGGGGRGGGFGGGGNPPQPPRKEIQEIEIFTNFFQLKNKPNWILYQYHVDFEPTIESKRLRFALMAQHRATLFDNSMAFDGMTLYSMKKLTHTITEIESKRNFDEAIIKLKIKLTNEVRPNSSEAMRLLNITFKRCLKFCGFQEFGKERAYFNFNEQHLHHVAAMGLKVASGYKAAMDVYQGEKILLCSELCHKLLNFKTCYEIMNDIYRENPHSFREACIRELVGQTVMTNYNNKTYRIDDINFDMHPKDTFKMRNDTDKSFVDYYYENYKLKVRDPENQVMLVSMAKNRRNGPNEQAEGGEPRAILLIPEFCVLTGTALLKPFANNFAVKKTLDGITKLNPDRRHEMMRDLMNKMRNEEKSRQEMANWSMEFDNEVVRVKAKLMKTVTVHFANNVVEETDRGWDSAIRNGHALSSVPLDKWTLFFLPRDEGTARNLMNELRRLAEAMGFRIRPGDMVRLSDQRGSTPSIYASSIRQNIRDSNPQMVMCILGSANKDVYDAIKRTCCVEFGVPSQCVTSSILNSGKTGKVTSVITKIAMQMNCKLGGEMWGVHIPRSNIMVVGMDVYKDSAQRNKSVAAFIASLNGTRENKLNCTRYYSKCQIEPKDTVFSTGLRGFMSGALFKYQEANRKLPDMIFIYRDGASEGQFAGIKEWEIPQILDAFKDVSPDYRPRLTFMVVNKRSNSRFFQRNERYGGFNNPPIGTVISETVVKREKEFYLISQSTNQGTVSPTHYHVMHDESEMIPERIQTLTYLFTHLYYNWPGQLRVPAPCHYAHKLAHLVGESLHEPHLPELDDKLFYL